MCISIFFYNTSWFLTFHISITVTKNWMIASAAVSISLKWHHRIKPYVNVSAYHCWALIRDNHIDSKIISLLFMSMETSKKYVVRPTHALFSLHRLEHTIVPNGNTQLCLLNNNIVNEVSYYWTWWDIIKCRWPYWTISKGYIIYDIWLSSSINS